MLKVRKEDAWWREGSKDKRGVGGERERGGRKVKVGRERKGGGRENVKERSWRRERERERERDRDR